MSEVTAQIFGRLGEQPITELPQDLYIPPDALAVILDTFEGPLDLLLYLIRRQNLNILDIPVSLITDQYLEYIALMDEMRFELAAEYLVMAAWLAEIKSRLLLPKPPAEDAEEDDPRAELVRRLQAYAEVQQAAQEIDELPRMHRDIFPAQARVVEVETAKPPPPALRELLLAFHELMQRAELLQAHQITAEPLSVRARMSRILERMRDRRNAELVDLWDRDEGRRGLVVTFLAVLELMRSGLLTAVQDAVFAPVRLKLAGAGGAA